MAVIELLDFGTMYSISMAVRPLSRREVVFILAAVRDDELMSATLEDQKGARD